MIRPVATAMFAIIGHIGLAAGQPSHANAQTHAAVLEELPPVSARDSLEARLAFLDSQVSEDPRNVQLRLSRLRAYYALAVPVKEHLDNARSEIERVRVLGSGSGLPTLLEGYLGALEVLEGKHAFWPHQKLSRVKRGLEMLDACIDAAGGDLELRYLRLVSTYYLPFFFGRGESAADDLAVLTDLLRPAPIDVSADVLVPALGFVLENGELDPDLRRTLEDDFEIARQRLELEGP